MKTKILFLFALCLAFVACNNSSDFVDKSEEKTARMSNVDIDIASINKIEYYGDIEMPDSIGELYNRYYREFDKNGFQVLQESFGSLDNLIEKKITEVDEYGYILKEDVIDGFTGEFSHESKYTYDELGNVVKIESFDKDHDLMSENVYEYNENGALLSTCSRFGGNNDEQMRNEYKYNDDGKLIYCFSQDFTNSYFRVYNYDYNEKGHVCNKLVLTDDDKVIQDFTYDYEFDQKDNWIKKIETDRGRVTHITVREIEYRQK